MLDAVKIGSNLRWMRQLCEPVSDSRSSASGLTFRSAARPGLCAAVLFISAIIPNMAAQAADEPPPAFRDAVRAGDLLFLSGQTGTVPTGKDRHTEGFDAAAQTAMNKLASVLERNAASFDDVVKCTVMLADIEDWPRFNVIYRQFFKADRLPARSAFGGTALAHGAPLEVECIAYIPTRS